MLFEFKRENGGDGFAVEGFEFYAADGFDDAFFEGGIVEGRGCEFGGCDFAGAFDGKANGNLADDAGSFL